MRNIIAYLKSIKRDVAITAATGVAAVEIRGRTIHSFAGIGFGDSTVNELNKSLQTAVRKRLREIDVLVLDEISMISAALFEKCMGQSNKLGTHTVHGQISAFNMDTRKVW